jgi:hypothetical protein
LIHLLHATIGRTANPLQLRLMGAPACQGNNHRANYAKFTDRTP